MRQNQIADHNNRPANAILEVLKIVLKEILVSVEAILPIWRHWELASDRKLQKITIDGVHLQKVRALRYLASSKKNDKSDGQTQTSAKHSPKLCKIEGSQEK